MIVSKEKGSVYFAYSLPFYTRIIGSNLTYKTMLSKDNLFFWKVRGLKNTIMSGGKEMYYNDLIRYDESIVDCKKINFENIIGTVKPNMIKKLEKYGGLTAEHTFQNSYFIAQNDNCFHIWCADIAGLEDFEYEFEAPYVAAFFAKYKDLDFFDKIYKGMCDMEDVTKNAFFPIVVTDTKTMKVNVIYDDGRVEYLYDL